ncbi:hypothetical protein DACRYDRAFT_79580 [Dacryopinax primogenitus]|uniref:Zf-MIZ-domain-containing protein n=1 Tax=Dacryopinax primogenitus (strain DJM 731) TaxID=1858805 RepID=M5FVN9_DACPD|nr:uncharacterized protein DACRYDRAFT_79580 [Dacryopinax primogenitus]EJU01896.1 hypothetical protein DACRYDRAFT_79580 [Dacryopinax primogenitus]
MVESQSDWTDFQQQRQRVSGLTVDRLKQLIHRLNDECNLTLLRTGKKQELVTRVQDAMDGWYQRQDSRAYRHARDVLTDLSSSGNSVSRRGSLQYLPPAVPATPQVAYSHYSGPNGYGHAPTTSYPYNGRSLQQSSSSPYSVQTPSMQPRSDIRFSASPFYKVIEPVSELATSQEAKDLTERKNLSITFNLTSQQREKLSAPNCSYQLRLYCTSSTHYSTSAFGRANPCPIEFPSTCEVRVNSTLLTANLRGLKKKPGTAPPADLGKTVRLAHSGSNKLDMIFMNNQTPFVPKRFYAVVNFVEVTTVHQIVDRIRKGKYRSAEEILARIKQTNHEDEDIVAGPSSLSLKCPMSYIRIQIPCRSKLCVHAQCFDAESWFSVMEQTTTWLCPVCEKMLLVDDLIVDGYFDSILRATPDSVDDVIMEADGEWHTSDNKYGSEGWKALRRVSLNPSTPARIEMQHDTMPGSGQHLPSPAEIFVIESDDDDDDSQIRHEISPPGRQRSISYPASGSPTRIRSSNQTVIDLTLSDDEISPPPAVRTKRPAVRDVSPSPPLVHPVKRARLDSDARRPDNADWLSPSNFNNHPSAGSAW